MGKWQMEMIIRNENHRQSVDMWRSFIERSVTKLQGVIPNNCGVGDPEEERE